MQKAYAGRGKTSVIAQRGTPGMRRYTRPPIGSTKWKKQAEIRRQKLTKQLSQSLLRHKELSRIKKVSRYKPPSSYKPSKLIIVKTSGGYKVKIPEKGYTFPSTYRNLGAARDQISQYLHTEARRAYWLGRGITYPTKGGRGVSDIILG